MTGVPGLRARRKPWPPKAQKRQRKQWFLWWVLSQQLRRAMAPGAPFQRPRCSRL